MPIGSLVSDGPFPGVAATPEQIQGQVQRVLDSPPFVRAPRMRRFLSFLVSETIAGRAGRLKEYTIATEVFGKPEDFEPGTSAVVRVEAGRLRRLLAQYQTEWGRDDLFQLDVPKGSYVPTISQIVASQGRPSEVTEIPGSGNFLRDGAWSGQQRRLVTALSCGLADESAKYALEGTLLTLMDNLHEQCAKIGLSRGGEVDASSSDRLMVYFGWPSAQEDAPSQALTAALEMLALADTMCADQPVALRIGIATSEAVVRGQTAGGQLRPAVIGEAPALATRMQLKAPQSGILVAESTRKMCGNEFQYLPAGELSTHDGGGLIWRLLGARTVTTRFRSRQSRVQGEMVGRLEERRMIESRWRLSLANEGQAFLLMGDAGIGKSRLAEGVLENIAVEGIKLRAQCSPHHSNSPLFPVIELLRSRLGKRRTTAGIVASLSRALDRLGMNSPVDLTLLTELVCGDGFRPSELLQASERKERTLKLLTQMVLALAKVKPLVVLVEDIHWADPTTLELIRGLIEASTCARTLILMTSRTNEASNFGQQTNLTAIGLSRLPREDCDQLIQRVAAKIELPSSVLGFIKKRAEGIPLFVEELTKLILSTQSVDLRSTAIPHSLSDLFAVQLDRLGETRIVAQVASTIGREFSHRMLALAMGGEERSLDGALDQLCAAGVMVRSDEPHGFAFRHSLFRDAAYRSIVPRERRDLHIQIGNLLIQSFPDVAAEQPELVAHHLFEGGHPGDSISFWLDAARRAGARYALDEAIADLEMAVTAARSLRGADNRARELALLLELASSIRTSRGYGDEGLLAIYERAESLANELLQPTQQLEVLYGLWTHAAGRGRWPRAHRLANRFEQNVRGSTTEPRANRHSLYLLGASHAFMGQFQLAHDHLTRALVECDAAPEGPRFDVDPGAASAAYLSWTLWHLGEMAASRRFANKALTAAELTRHRPTIAMVLSWLTFRAVCDDDLDAIEQHNARLQEICGFGEGRFWQPFGAACAEWAAFQIEPSQRRLVRLQEFTDAFEERYMTSCLLVLAARMCLKLDRPQEGLEHIERAKSFIREHDERLWEAEALRVEAELMNRNCPQQLAEIDRVLAEAVGVAESQGALQLSRRANQTRTNIAAEIRPSPTVRRA